MDRRHWLSAAAAVAVASCGLFPARESTGRVVTVHTRKFEFVPQEIVLKRGEPVVLELVADDVIMGFRCKELNLRTDIRPGKPAQLRFTPMAAGRFHFFCDVFCGDGHEDMDGHITVTA